MKEHRFCQFDKRIDFYFASAHDVFAVFYRNNRRTYAHGSDAAVFVDRYYTVVIRDRVCKVSDFGRAYRRGNFGGRIAVVYFELVFNGINIFYYGDIARRDNVSVYLNTDGCRACRSCVCRAIAIVIRAECYLNFIAVDRFPFRVERMIGLAL